MNPYQTPNDVIREGEPIEPPARPRCWATIVKLVACGFLLFVLWGDGAVSIGGGHFSRTYGFIGYYHYESMQGVVTQSEIMPVELAFTIFVSLAIVVFGAYSVYRHFLPKPFDAR